MAWPLAFCSRPWRSWRHKTINREETALWLDQAIPAPLEFKYVDGRHLGLAQLEGGQSLAVTTEFSQVDTGLQLADASSTDVRTELLAVARGTQADVAAVVLGAAESLEKAQGIIPAQPGVMLPSIVDIEGMSVKHGLLIAPYLWGGDSPQFTEPGRMTLVCQLLMLTDSEYAFVVEEGVAAFQAAAEEHGIDLLDYARANE